MCDIDGARIRFLHWPISRYDNEEEEGRLFANLLLLERALIVRKGRPFPRPNCAGGARTLGPDCVAQRARAHTHTHAHTRRCSGNFTFEPILPLAPIERCPRLAATERHLEVPCAQSNTFRGCAATAAGSNTLPTLDRKERQGAESCSRPLRCLRRQGIPIEHCARAPRTTAVTSSAVSGPSIEQNQ